MSLSRISPSGDGISERRRQQQRLAVKPMSEQSGCRAQGFTTWFRNAVRALARDAGSRLGRSGVIGQSWPAPSHEARGLGPILRGLAQVPSPPLESLSKIKG